MDRLRLPFFIVAMILILLAALGEAGSAAFLSQSDSELRNLGGSAPGWGVPTMALLDGLIFFAVGLMGLSMILPKGIHAKIQGILTLIVSFLLLLGSVVMGFAILMLLLLMVGLLLAPIFGTALYLAVYGHFDTGAAAAMLSVLMLLKIGFAICLVLAHQRFLQNKGLVLLVLTTLIAQILTSFLQGFPPGILVSITDAIAGLITVILAVIWTIFFLIGSIISVVKALRVDKDLSGQAG
ncbi:MAG TPA: hypothetical protein VMU54_07815 [Planctomycetota bacterium]|nr:hypothetical protein [Planctomycetota bacterium]